MNPKLDMNEILDHEPQKEQGAVPILIVGFTLSVFIRLIGSVFILQNWFYARELIAVSSFMMLLFWILSLKIFRQKKDGYLRFYSFLFGSGVIVKIVSTIFGLQAWGFNWLFLGGIFFELGALLLLIRYYLLFYQLNTSTTILTYPFLISSPVFVIGLVFKFESWRYASELIVLGGLLFVLTAMFLLIRILLKREVSNKGIKSLLLIAAMILIIGIVFKIQSWPFAMELITVGLLSLLLGVGRSIFKRSIH